MRQTWAQDARARLGRLLDDVLGDRLRATAKRPRDGAGWVDVSAHDLRLDCPARWSVRTDDFVLSTRTVAGAVGRLALRERSEGEPVGAAVDRVLAGLDELDGVAFYADWYADDLDRSGRAALRAAATTWAVGALQAVRGRPLAWAPQRQSVDVEGRMVRLRSNWDASDGRARPDVLVVLSGRPVDDPAHALVAGFNALVDGLLRRQVPDRVRMGSAATATTAAVPVTPQLLDLAVDRVVELVRLRAEPDTATAVPGPGCRDCHHLDACPEGTAHVAG